jgi:hypothetical protein
METYTKLTDNHDHDHDYDDNGKPFCPYLLQNPSVNLRMQTTTTFVIPVSNINCYFFHQLTLEQTTTPDLPTTTLETTDAKRSLPTQYRRRGIRYGGAME